MIDPPTFLSMPPNVALYLCEIQGYVSARSPAMAMRMHLLGSMMMGLVSESFAVHVSWKGSSEAVVPPVRVVEYFESVAHSRACAIPFQGGLISHVTTEYSEARRFTAHEALRILLAWAKIRDIVGPTEYVVSTVDLENMMGCMLDLPSADILASLPDVDLIVSSFADRLSPHTRDWVPHLPAQTNAQRES